MIIFLLVNFPTVEKLIMISKQLVKEWFDKWKSGDFLKLPITDEFSHVSPFGIIDGKDNYLQLVSDNKEKFLGYNFEIIDAIYEKEKACVRYIANQNDFKLEVSEWYYFKNGLINKIHAYYHIGEIREDRKLK